MRKSRSIEFGFGFLKEDYPSHSDNFYELHYIYQGTGKLVSEDCSYNLFPNLLVISSPNEKHRITVEKQLVFHIIRIFSPESEKEIIDRLCTECRTRKGFVIPETKRFEIDRLKILSSVDDAMAEKAAWNGLISILSELLIPEHQLNAVYSDDTLLKVVRYMEQNLQKKISIGELATLVALTPSRLSHLFKDKTGFSTIDYFLRLKVDAACYLLKTSDYLNKEMAEYLGFSDEFHFSKIFKKKTGLSPREFKNRMKAHDGEKVHKLIVESILPIQINARQEDYRKRKER